MALRQGRPGRSLVARETPWGYLQRSERGRYANPVVIPRGGA